MIVELSVENIAVIEQAQLKPGPGFTVVTGETGAGKSLLVDAIGLALGERADSDLVRSGSARGSVRVLVDLSSRPSVAAACEAIGVIVEQGILSIQREVSAEGRSTVRVGGKIVPVGQLKALGNLLVDMHGQHDHQALLDPLKHLEYLDLWIGPPALTMRAEIAGIYDGFLAKQRALATIQRGVRERQQRIDMLRFQTEEIGAVGVRVGEFEEIYAQLSRLKNAEKIREMAGQALGELMSAEVSGLDLISSALKNLEQVERLDESCSNIVSDLRSAHYVLQEVSRDLSRYFEEMGSDPEKLAELMDRSELLQKLFRKYGENEADVLAFCEEAGSELALLENASSSEESLVVEVEALQERLYEKCAELSTLRNQFAVEFSGLVVNELRELALEKAQFELRFTSVAPSAMGSDSVEFFFSANPGEAMRALSRVASGGEMSRVMLALKVVLAGKAGVPTLIFDEIDTGLSGRAAAVVARKLRQISQFYQVLSISHLPQLAGLADEHFLISKQEKSGRTYVEVRALEGDERVSEVARMLAGEVVSESAMANARDLLSR